MRNDLERFLDIQEAIAKIEKYAAKGRDIFYQDELIQSWIVRHLQIIGEASRSISEDAKKKYTHLPWSKMIGMRNILVHDYFGIDKDIVWAVVEKDLPPLKENINKILTSLK